MSAINVNSITGRTGTHGPVLTGVTTATNGLHVGSGVSVSGISTFNNTVVGGATTELVVGGDARITGILTVGQGSVTISGDGISGITTAGITTAYVTSINDLNFPTAGSLSNRNIIINGAMQVAQRGTSSTTSGYGSVDRYHVQYNGETVTHSQTAITSGSPYNEGFRSILRITNTSASSAADSIRNSLQYIEAQNLANSGWNYASSSSYVTLSFWVRSSVEQEFYGYLRTFDGTEQGYSFSLGTLSANTWVKVTKVIPGNSNITVDNDNGTGLQVNISPFWGTNFTDAGNTLNTWGNFVSGNRTPDYTNTWASTAGATFDITGVQLELGSKATPFEHESYGQTLAKCQRYFYAMCNAAAEGTDDVPLASGCYYATNTFYGVTHFPTTMRVKPSMTASSGSAGEFVIYRDSNSNSLTSILQADEGLNSSEFYANSSQNASGAQNWPGFLRAVGNTSYVFFDAEL